MRVFVVFCHPSETSFTYNVYRKFVEGLQDAGHEIVVSDLYQMDFKTDLTEAEYLRETYYKAEDPVLEDVKIEQDKSDILILQCWNRRVVVA